MNYSGTRIETMKIGLVKDMTISKKLYKLMKTSETNTLMLKSQKEKLQMESLSDMSDDILERCIKDIKQSTYGMLRKENRYMLNDKLLKALLDGKKLTRDSWGKGKYIYFDKIKDCTLTEQGDDFAIRFGDNSSREYKIYEEPPILDDEEKVYLSAVIKPFKKRIIGIIKNKSDSYFGKGLYLYIEILLNNYDAITLPLFSSKSPMYKGMEIDRRYTLKELGLSD